MFLRLYSVADEMFLLLCTTSSRIRPRAVCISSCSCAKCRTYEYARCVYGVCCICALHALVGCCRGADARNIRRRTRCARPAPRLRQGANVDVLMVECSIGMSRRGSGGCIVVIVAVLLVELTFAPPPPPPSLRFSTWRNSASTLAVSCVHACRTWLSNACHDVHTGERYSGQWREGQMHGRRVDEPPPPPAPCQGVNLIRHLLNLKL
jgi:hypothetical protein